MEKLNFNKEFIFGTATAAYQIEGAWDREGRGASIWDIFTHKKGKIRSGDNGDVACDHYYRYKDDVKLMNKLDLQAYRFSVSWSRVVPEGIGPVNPRGLDFYKRLVDELLVSDIVPFITLYHWDMPQTLYEKCGGFRSRECSHYFADYVEVVVKALGDRVKNWITLNEPWEHATMGYLLGEHAPGKKSPWHYLKIIHHQLLAHGYAMERIRSIAPEAKAGITISYTPIHPGSNSEKDRNAALVANQFMNFVTLDPLYKRQYPKELWKALRLFQPNIKENDMEVIATPTDFLGVNTYSREHAVYKWYVPFLKLWISGSGVPDNDFIKDGIQHTSMGWEVYPECMSEVLSVIREQYGNPPVYITENGAAFDDVETDGSVKDIKRVEFLKTYLRSLKQSFDEGSDLRGYFIWSFMDNFEWAAGFDKRFGIVYVDYGTQKRIIKDSGYWYRDLIRLNRENY